MISRSQSPPRGSRAPHHAVTSQNGRPNTSTSAASGPDPTVGASQSASAASSGLDPG